MFCLLGYIWIYLTLRKYCNFWIKNSRAYHIFLAQEVKKNESNNSHACVPSSPIYKRCSYKRQATKIRAKVKENETFSNFSDSTFSLFGYTLPTRKTFRETKQFRTETILDSRGQFYFNLAQISKERNLTTKIELQILSRAGWPSNNETLKLSVARIHICTVRTRGISTLTSFRITRESMTLWSLSQMYLAGLLTFVTFECYIFCVCVYIYIYMFLFIYRSPWAHQEEVSSSSSLAKKAGRSTRQQRRERPLRGTRATATIVCLPENRLERTGNFSRSRNFDEGERFAGLRRETAPPWPA